ncbi:MAG: type II toxin-antitoxin system Phd/YefM family antitoxin [Thermomicrobiales bacterium]
MPETVSATEARIHFGQLMRTVVEKGETVVVERGGKPQVVILSISEYKQRLGDQLTRPDWQDLVRESRALVQRSLNGRPLSDIDQIIHDMREERDAQILDSLGIGRMPCNGS